MWDNSGMTEAAGEPAPAPRPPLPWVTIVIAAINVAVFAWSLSAGADFAEPTAAWMLQHGGNFGPRTFDGEQWRLVTAMFLHYGFLHVAMNMIGLLDGGRHVERMYGRAGFIAIYVVAGLFASFASALRGNAVSAGASGAIFGVFGAFGAFLFLHRDRLDREMVAKQSRGLLVFLGLNIYIGLSSPSIDLVAHAGGLVAGFVLGIALELGTHQDQSTVKRSVLVAVLGTALVIVAAFVAPRPVNAVIEFQRVESLVIDRWNSMRLALPAAMGSGAEAADKLERDILQPWRDGRVAFERDATPAQRERVLAYIRMREEGWAMLVDAVRSGDHALAQQALERIAKAEDIVAN